MATKQRSKTVDDAIKTCWAKLATKVFRRAMVHIDTGDMQSAKNCMSWVETWLDSAGAQATRCNFSTY